MSTKTTCRRQTKRLTVSDAVEAWVEFEHATAEGRSWRQRVVDLSVSGFSFVLDDELTGLESGCDLARVVLQIGASRVRGDLLVMHVTQALEGGRLCGALFYPTTDRDLSRLKSTVAAIGAEPAG